MSSKFSEIITKIFVFFRLFQIGFFCKSHGEKCKAKASRTPGGLISSFGIGQILGKTQKIVCRDMVIVADTADKTEAWFAGPVFIMAE